MTKICSYTTALFAHVLAIATCTTFEPQKVMSTKADNRKLYFGFGSNLWRHQMATRCPNSAYLGVARLSGFKWIIYNRGYANVVETSNQSAIPAATHAHGSSHDADDEVYGLVYALTPSDEARLDVNEGVPWVYQKEMLDVEFWPAEGNKWVSVSDRHHTQIRRMLVYVDRNGTTEGRPKPEYIYRMVGRSAPCY